MIEQLKSNVANVRQRIADAAVRSGRTAADVELVAVTKYVDAATTRALFQAGCHVLGEGRPQVLWEKADSFSDPDLSWHLVGHLQRNKVNRTVALTDLIHSVDSTRLLNSINAAGSDLDRPINVLLEVDVSGESSKQGFERDGLVSALDYVSSLKFVSVKGLMCMAGLGLDESQTRQQFAQLRSLREELSDQRTDNIDLQELSMGMSADFEWAIEEGATIVRIGSLLFDGLI